MEDLFERFPGMKPVKKPPIMHSINGIGTTVYGARDHDPETGTYVKTLWLIVLFIPILPLAAYRVHDAPNGGWYFLGKVPLGRGPLWWSLTLTLALIGIIVAVGINERRNSPSAKAAEALKQADEMRDRGNYNTAAKFYRDVALGKTDQAPRAMTALNDLVQSPDLQSPKGLPHAGVVFGYAAELKDQPGGLRDIAARATRFIQDHKKEDPNACLAVLEAVEPKVEKPAEVLPLKRELLEAMYQKQPGQLDICSRLALVYEAMGQRDRCLALLEPVRAKLEPTSEGARILGLLLYQQGKQEEAFALLQPYADARLKTLHMAEQQYKTTLNLVENQLMGNLKSNQATDFNYQAHKAAGAAQQQQMVEDYLTSHMRNDSSIQNSLAALRREAVVVDVALDLGIMRLERAQKMADPAQRKAELKRAEDTLQSISGIGGNDPNYKLTLGQVDFWLGKQAEGRKLFDEVLEGGKNNLDTQMHVAQIYRELGMDTDAQKLLESAYNKPNANQEQRQKIAMLRALTYKDLEDQITWLERANLTAPETKANLSQAKGDKAKIDGKDAEAAQHYQAAIAIYASMPENSATLNNGGLVHLSLYMVTGDLQTLKKGVGMLEKALELKPGDGILVVNVANQVYQVGLTEVVGDALDFARLKRQVNHNDLLLLYKDREGQEEIRKRLQANRTIGRARKLLERSLVLQPGNRGQYLALMQVLASLEDKPGLMALERRAAEAPLDRTPEDPLPKEPGKGKEDDKTRQQLKTAVAHKEKILAAAGQANRTTQAAALLEMVNLRMIQEAMGEAIDADAVVKLAEEAHQLCPSAGTLTPLQSTLLLRANKQLVARDKDYASLADKWLRLLGSRYLIALALVKEGKLRTAVLANPDVQRVLGLIKEEHKRLPSNLGGWSWAMLQAADPQEAKNLAATLKKNEILPLELAIENRLLAPTSLQVLRQCWLLKARGQLDKEKEVWQAALRAGVALPGDVP